MQLWCTLSAHQAIFIFQSSWAATVTCHALLAVISCRHFCFNTQNKAKHKNKLESTTCCYSIKLIHPNPRRRFILLESSPSPGFKLCRVLAQQQTAVPTCWVSHRCPSHPEARCGRGLGAFPNSEAISRMSPGVTLWGRIWLSQGMMNQRAN